MLHLENDYIKEHLLDGCFGLEKESLRITGDGHFSHTPHPFPGDSHIVRDFCENQIEINTGVHSSPEGAVAELEEHTRQVEEKLQAMPEKEYLWPFSNPPYIKNELDIPIAQYEGELAEKTAYREHLSRRYGRYKMTFSGIHVNFSFTEDLLKKDYELHLADQPVDSEYSFKDYKNDLYLALVKRLSVYGWILIPINAASPLLDSSFMEKGVYDGDIYTGMSSVRCSEMGYWNEFTPIFNYENVEKYTDSIRRYVDDGTLRAATELYFPVRLKPPGANSLEALREKGADHIELRMFDLNPLEETGIDVRDIKFAHLLIIWLACTPAENITLNDQVHAVQNFKNASRYDLKTVYMYDETGDSYSFVTAAKLIIERMRMFFRPLGIPVNDILDYEYAKFENSENRYSRKVRKLYSNSFVQKGLELVKSRAQKAEAQTEPGTQN